jgi:hypothetical protein
MQVYVRPNLLTNKSPGILLGFQASSELYIALKIPLKTNVDFKEHITQISRLVCGGIYILGLETDSKQDDKSIIAKLDQIGKLYAEKFPKVHFMSSKCRLFRKTLEDIDFTEKGLPLSNVTTNLSIEISANKSSPDYELQVKKGFLTNSDLLENSEYKINDSHAEVFFPMSSKNTSFRPIKKGELEVRVIAQLSSRVLGLHDDINEIKKDLKKCLLEQMNVFAETKTLTKRLYFEIEGLWFSEYNHVLFSDCKQKFRDVLGLEMDPTDEMQFRSQQPTSPKGFREKKKLVEVDDNLEPISNSTLLSKKKIKELEEELPSNSLLIQKSQNSIHQSLDSIHQETLGGNTSFSIENREALIEDITDQVELHPLSNSQVLQKNVGKTVTDIVKDQDVPSNSTVLSKGISEGLGKVVKESERIPSNSEILSSKIKVTNVTTGTSFNVYLVIGVVFLVISFLLYRMK